MLSDSDALKTRPQQQCRSRIFYDSSHITENRSFHVYDTSLKRSTQASAQETGAISSQHGFFLKVSVPVRANYTSNAHPLPRLQYPGSQDRTGSLDKPQRAVILSRSTLKDGDVRFVLDAAAGADQQSVSLEQLANFVSDEQLHEFGNDQFAFQDDADEGRIVPRRKAESRHRSLAVNRTVPRPQQMEETSASTLVVNLDYPDVVTGVPPSSRGHPDIAEVAVDLYPPVRAVKASGLRRNRREAAGLDPDRRTPREINDELRRIGLGHHVHDRQPIQRVAKRPIHIQRLERSEDAGIVNMEFYSYGPRGHRRNSETSWKGVKPVVGVVKGEVISCDCKCRMKLTINSRNL